MKPPFEIYGKVHIADTEGHVCTCENEEIAKTILELLNATVGLYQDLVSGNIQVVPIQDPVTLHTTLRRIFGE